MGEECSACRQWEEGLYWNNFHSVQFFRSLSGRFHQQLAIPKKFANNMREKLSVTVALKGPTGASWTVGLTACGDTLFFEKGWKKFVEDNCLEEDDVLMFKYNRDSCFDVCLFKIASETNIDSVVMDVTIFRVVKEVVASTRLNPSALRARKP